MVYSINGSPSFNFQLDLPTNTFNNSPVQSYYVPYKNKFNSLKIEEPSLGLETSTQNFIKNYGLGSDVYNKTLEQLKKESDFRAYAKDQVTKQALGQAGVGILSTGINDFMQKAFDETELSRGLGNFLSTGISTAVDTVGNNLLTGSKLTSGLGTNVGSSLANTAINTGMNYGMQALSDKLGDTAWSRGLTTGIGKAATGVLGTTITSAIQAGRAIKTINSVGKAIGEAKWLRI